YMFHLRIHILKVDIRIESTNPVMADSRRLKGLPYLPKAQDPLIPNKEIQLGKRIRQAILSIGNSAKKLQSVQDIPNNLLVCMVCCRNGFWNPRQISYPYLFSQFSLLFIVVQQFLVF